ncbi:DUF4192 family protein [Cellulomonas alba]|uniref:DUF4192 family protein n=1 Tax=Cellulomonas alba TaxID=3053467 RepID=A0ABT7SBM4_9CELL|nr:DUF4192 family protein [Cellulomonas alba]MDM7853588.1 DUF4192 family protein [Cellulomonas alba]
MTTTPTLRVSEPRELLALVPHRLGFRAAKSAVAVSLRTSRGRVGLVVRVDLADLADARTGPHVARLLVARLGRDGAARSVLVVYVDDDPRPVPDGPAHQAAKHFRAAAEPALGEVPVWVVTRTGYLALDGDDECSPPGGRPLRELDATQVGAHYVLAGSAVADDRSDVARIPRATGDQRRDAARARRRQERRLEEALLVGEEELQAWRLEALEAWRSVVARYELRDGVVTALGDVSAARWGRLEAGLADRRTRDAVLVSLVPGTGDLPERSLHGDSLGSPEDAAVGSALARIVDAAVGVRPPVGATAVHEHVLEGVVGHGRSGAQAPALTLLALLAWWRGEGARAGQLLERALHDEPTHRLAGLVARAVGAGIAPGWAAAQGG